MTDKELHYGFMCDALNGLLARALQTLSDGKVIENEKDYAHSARIFADAALAEFKKRWEEEKPEYKDWNLHKRAVDSAKKFYPMCKKCGLPMFSSHKC